MSSKDLILGEIISERYEALIIFLITTAAKLSGSYELFKI